jgi:Tfp pilus assembly protein FimT
VLRTTQKQRGDAQALGSRSDAVPQEALVQALHHGRLEVRHWHGREYTRGDLPGNAKWLNYSAFEALWERVGNVSIRAMRMRKGSRGVTLIELCVGLAVVATLTGLAIPEFRADLRASAVRGAAFELLAGLQQTRAASIVEGRTGVLCLVDAAGNCLTEGVEASSWRAFLEVEGRAAPLAGQFLPPGVVVRASRARLTFWPDSLAASTGTLTICDSQRIARPRAIIISQGGRARVTNSPETPCQ